MINTGQMTKPKCQNNSAKMYMFIVDTFTAIYLLTYISINVLITVNCSLFSCQSVVQTVRTYNNLMSNSTGLVAAL